MDISEFKSELKAGTASGVYIFAGEEEYLVRYYLSSLRSSIVEEPAFAVFNNPVYDGSEVDFAALVDAVKSPPMMADKKLIEWRHADFTSFKESDIDLLDELVDLVREHPYSVVAFSASAEGLDFGTAKNPSKFISKFGKSIKILRFEKSTENQLYAWLKKHFDAEGVAVTLDTLKALVFRSGHSMEVLGREVEKLSALAHARGTGKVTPEDVYEVASTTPECDTFALSNAITERSRSKAYAALEEMKFRRVDPTVVMGMISKTFSDIASVAYLLEEGRDARDIEGILKMNVYKLKIYISAAKRYTTSRIKEILGELARVDAGAKFGGVTGYTAIELFISKSL